MTRAYVRKTPLPERLPTPRELEIAHLRAKGKTLRELAPLYGLSHERIRVLAINGGYIWKPKVKIPKRRITREERFWNKVHKSNAGDCWEWQGSLNPTGYGSFKVSNSIQAAHQAAYIFSNGPIPEGKWILHRCDNRRCCNPAHLYAGTPKENCRDRKQRSDWDVKKRLSMETVKDIRKRFSEHETLSDISKSTGVEYVRVWRIAHGKSYTRVDVWNPETDTHTPAILVDGNPPAVIPSPSSPFS